MSEVANIYDNGPISPIARINDNLSIWSAGAWNHSKIDYIEPLPRSTPMVAEMVALTGNVTIAANGQLAQNVVAILQLADHEFAHLRWEPLDDVEGILWEQSSQGRFVTRSVHARVSAFTHLRDPYLATSTFYVMGRNRDMNLQVQNPRAVAQPIARFIFWGYRYLLVALATTPSNTTWVPAEGKQISS